MSQMPLLFRPSATKKFANAARAKSLTQKVAALSSFRPRDFTPRVGLQLGLTDPVAAMNMGETAELLAREFSISREEQDAFAFESNRRAIAARGKLASEICPVFTADGKVVAADNGPRENQSLNALAKLRPVFDPNYGTVTAGNSSQITDGAVALLVMEVQRAAEFGLKPIGALRNFAVAGCDPARMGLGPLFALAELKRRSGLGVRDANLIEINEAFAAQALAVMRGSGSPEFAREHLGRDTALGEIAPEILNVNGGAIALGHPVGATGARLILTALKELDRRKEQRALVSLCVGGGQGAALWLERLP